MIDIIRHRIASVTNESVDSITICVSGMAAIYAALKATHTIFQEKFEYVKNNKNKDIESNGDHKEGEEKEKEKGGLKSVVEVEVDGSTGGEHSDDSSEDEVGGIVVFGFPYLDTLKMMRTPGLNPWGCIFYGSGDEADLDAFETLLKSNRDRLSLRISSNSRK